MEVILQKTRRREVEHKDNEIESCRDELQSVAEEEDGENGEDGDEDTEDRGNFGHNQLVRNRIVAAAVFTVLVDHVGDNAHEDDAEEELEKADEPCCGAGETSGGHCC